MTTQTNDRMTTNIEAILNCRPDVRHRYYDLHLSDAIRIVLNAESLALLSPQCSTLEDVHDRLCASNPGHTWITGAAATELVETVLAFAPTTYTARRGGTLLQLRGATKRELEARGLSPGFLIALDTGAAIAKQSLDDLATNHNLYLAGEPLTSPKSDIDPMWMLDALKTLSGQPHQPEDDVAGPAPGR